MLKPFLLVALTGGAWSEETSYAESTLYLWIPSYFRKTVKKLGSAMQ